MPRQNLTAGEYLFHADTPSACGYLIEHGTIELRTRRGGTGREAAQIVVARLGAGELVGDISAAESGPHSVDAVAVTDAVVLEIDGEQIRDRLATADPILRMVLDGRVKRWRRMLTLLRGDDPAAAQSVVGATSLPAQGKFLLEEQLREALQRQQLEVRYQPILEIASGRIVGYEALVRWLHPERGEVSPEEFIHLAEETSLIVPVGEYVFDAAFAALDQLRADPMPFVAVNVSARQLASPGLIERVVARREALELPTGCIKVEITESQALDVAQVATLIELCHTHAIAVSLDDFGTRYSHLAHLHLLAFDTLKIDQAFVQAMFVSDKAMQIVRAIVAMARAIDAEIVVEGVETTAQLQFFGEIGCRFAQGFVIGRAQPLETVLAAR